MSLYIRPGQTMAWCIANRGHVARYDVHRYGLKDVAQSVFADFLDREFPNVKDAVVCGRVANCPFYNIQLKLIRARWPCRFVTPKEVKREWSMPMASAKDFLKTAKQKFSVTTTDFELAYVLCMTSLEKPASAPRE